MLRSLVESGNAKIDERTTFHGVPAYKLTVSGAAQHYLNGTVFVARDDYRPLEIETTTDSPLGAVTETIEYQTYEHLPGTEANRSLLDLSAQHPDARVVTQSSGASSTTTGSK